MQLFPTLGAETSKKYASASVSGADDGKQKHHDSSNNNSGSNKSGGGGGGGAASIFTSKLRAKDEKEVSCEHEPCPNTLAHTLKGVKKVMAEGSINLLGLQDQLSRISVLFCVCVCGVCVCSSLLSPKARVWKVTERLGNEGKHAPQVNGV